MVRTYLSLATAEALLPAISQLLRKAQTLKQQLDRYERLERRVTSSGSLMLDIGENLDAEHHGIVEEIYKAIDEIEARGGIVRSVEDGTVDFYTRFEGRDVLLSWHLGERRIRHWHELDEDEAGRKCILEVK